VEEYFHIKGRDFRLDFAWPDRKLGVEVQGMAHRIKGKFHSDIEKRALAMLDGWKVLEVSGQAVRDERGIEWLKQLMKLAVDA
jgi:very-short-patch-repair endonuclease